MNRLLDDDEVTGESDPQESNPSNAGHIDLSCLASVNPIVVNATNKRSRQFGTDR